MNLHRLLASAVLLIGLAAAFSPAIAQPGRGQTPGESAKLLDEVRLQIAEGRAQLDANQNASVETLRAVAQKSLENLASYMGPGVLTAPPEQIPATGFWAAAARQAGEAHYWWGRAADFFGRRDEAIAALARATRFAGRLRPNAGDTLARDSLLSLGGALRDGLPLLAPDDVLVTVAETAHGKLWSPRRLEVELPSVAPVRSFSLPATAKQEFLLTSGRVFPPVPSSAVDASAMLSRVPPIYRNVPAASLPAVLRLDRMIIGYGRETEGEDKGLWRQRVRVFYASSHLTRENRDDRPRAEVLCAQFLKVHALFGSTLQLSNPYVRDGVTTIWLTEVSALWPADDLDPRVRTEIGVAMPRINTPSVEQREIRDIEALPMSFPWQAATAGQMDSAPGDVLLFKMTEQRSEAAWLRQLMHEYGHVVLPPVNGFRPPLEPFANGVLGETLGMMWAAAAPEIWKLPQEFGGIGEEEWKTALDAQVMRQAILPLSFWKSHVSNTPLRRDAGARGLLYLQGMTVYVERVYGGEVLRRAFLPMLQKVARIPDTQALRGALTTDSLMATFPAALRDPFRADGVAASGVLPIWLPGAADGAAISTQEFLTRAPLPMKNGNQIRCWLYVPPTASTLRVEWKSVVPAAALLKIQAPNRLTAVAPQNFAATNAAVVDVTARTGWQRMTFIAQGELEIVASQFEWAR